MSYLTRLFFLVIMFQLIPNISIGQNKKVSNIFFRTIGEKIEIFYDLPRNSDTLDIRIYFRKRSDPKTKHPLKWAKGSIGVGKFSGRKQKVVWSYKKEPAHLFTGSGFYYEIIANKISLGLQSQE